MSTHEQQELEEVVERIVQSVLDARLRKLVISIWAMIVGGLGSLIFLGVQWGELKADVAHNRADDEKHHHDTNVHMTTSAKFQTFVSREELTAMVAQRDRSLDEVRAAILRLEAKLDKALEEKRRGE